RTREDAQCSGRNRLAPSPTHPAGRAATHSPPDPAVSAELCEQFSCARVSRGACPAVALAKAEDRGYVAVSKLRECYRRRAHHADRIFEKALEAIAEGRELGVGSVVRAGSDDGFAGMEKQV